MYYDFYVKLPDVPGKYTYMRRGDATYVKYEYARIYDPEKKFTYPQRSTIGKLSPDDKEAYQITKNQRQIAKQQKIISLSNYSLKPNSMQVGFITNLKKIITDKENNDRALLISATGARHNIFLSLSLAPRKKLHKSRY